MYIRCARAFPAAKWMFGNLALSAAFAAFAASAAMLFHTGGITISRRISASLFSHVLHARQQASKRLEKEMPRGEMGMHR